MAKTILLDPNTWDMLVDASGNIAVADEPYRLVQDVQTACLTVADELYFDNKFGINYLGDLMGKKPPLVLVQNIYESIALTVPGVTKAVMTVTSLKNRVLNGYLTINGTINVSI